jgi:hypothetical protein
MTFGLVVSHDILAQIEPWLAELPQGTRAIRAWARWLNLC